MTEAKKTPKKPRGKACLLAGKCIACGARCQSVCPADAVEMNEAGEPIILLDKCIGCVKCVKVCPVQALEMFFTPEEQQLLDELANSGTAQAQEEESEEAGQGAARRAAGLRSLGVEAGAAGHEDARGATRLAGEPIASRPGRAR